MPASPTRPIRSLMFVPGHKTAWIDRIPASGADAVVLDLEDSVPAALKAQARATVSAALPRLPATRPLVFVRTNKGRHAYCPEDVAAVVQPGLAGIFVAKAEDPVDVEALSRMIAEAECARGMAVGSVSLIVAIETARAAQFVFEIASNPRVSHIAAVTARGADLERNLGFAWTSGGLETLYHRSQAVIAARAAGKPHVIGGMWQEVHDLDGLRRAAEFNKTLGFSGEIVLHPSNVAVVNEVFSPHPEQLAHYRGMIAAFAAAEREGQGAILYRGEHVDIAHVATAKAFLALWGLPEQEPFNPA